MTLWISGIFYHRILPTNSNDTNRSVFGPVSPRITRIGERDGGHDDNTGRPSVNEREPDYRAHREEARQESISGFLRAPRNAPRTQRQGAPGYRPFAVCYSALRRGSTRLRGTSSGPQ